MVNLCTFTGNSTDWIVDFSNIESKFSLRSANVPDEDLCYIVPGEPETISACGFNTETQTFIVIHGWTVNTSSVIDTISLMIIYH